MKTITEIAKTIQLVIFDVDGVLTDGSLFFGDDGQEYKAFNSKDGHGIRMLQHGGIKTAIITGRTSNVVERRAKDLDIEIIMQGHRDKRPAFAEILKITGLSADVVAYVGDDIVDLPVMTQVGLAIAVNDANYMVKRHAHWITSAAGGKGAAREICEFLLDSQDKLNEQLESYL